MFVNDYLDAIDLRSREDFQNGTHPYIAKCKEASVHPAIDTVTRNRILCVDDDIVATATRAEMLTECGYSVAVYHSPFAVLECDLSHFDLAILDFIMPGLNGRELLLHLRRLGAAFPIVLLTGCLDALSRDDCVLFARCIDKAMSIHHLLDVIAEFLDPKVIPDYEP